MTSQTVQPELLGEPNKVGQSQHPPTESLDCVSLTVKTGCTEETATGVGKSDGLIADPFSKSDPCGGVRVSDVKTAVKEEPMEWADDEKSCGKEEENIVGDEILSSSDGPTEAGDSACESSTSVSSQKASSHGALRVQLKDIVEPSANIKLEPLDLSASAFSQKFGVGKEGDNIEENVEDEENTTDSDFVNDEKSVDCDDDGSDDDEDDNEMESLPIYFQSDSSNLHQNKDLERLNMQVANHAEEGEENESPHDLSSKACPSGSDMKTNHICHICHEQFPGKTELRLHVRSHQSTENLSTFVQELASQVLSENKAAENGKNPVQCPHCQEMFASEYELGGHIKLHYREQRRRCRHCAKVFKCAYDCREHERKEHSDKELVKCVLRSQMVSESSDQPISAEQNSSSDSFKCKICLSAFASAAELVAHRKSHSDKSKVQAVSKKDKEADRNKKTERGKRSQPRKCPQCGSEFKNAKNLRSHMRVHSKVKPYTCDECTAAFVRSSDLRRHKKTHTGEKGFKCQLCTSAFADSSKLKIHMRIHTGERPYKCQLCKEAFSQASQYSRHMRVHNGEKPYQCPYCPSAFTMTSDYRRHLKIHTGERPFMCEYCPASFPEAKNLRIHVRTHTGEKPYKCEFCNSAFAQTANLKRHIKTHTGERPAKCELCPSAFADKHKLRVHMRSHSGEKPYQCQTCPSAFATSSALNRHYIMHSGAKPYKCEHCPALFAHMSKLRVHAVCHSFNGPFKCQLCTASFKNAYGLTVHSHVHE